MKTEEHGTVVKADLIDQVYDRVGFTRQEAVHAVETVFSEIKASLARGENVRIVGFASFNLRKKTHEKQETPKPVKPSPSVQGRFSPSNPAGICWKPPTARHMSKAIPDKLFSKSVRLRISQILNSMFCDIGKKEFDQLKPTKNPSGQRLYQRKDIDLVLDIKRLLYTEKFTLAGARQKLKERKKKNSQMHFGFDREKFLDWKNRLKAELEDILHSLEN